MQKLGNMCYMYYSHNHVMHVNNYMSNILVINYFTTFLQTINVTNFY